MSERASRIWPVVAIGTMCSAFPVFLTGALGVQLRDDIGLTATHVGLSMGSSFGVAAVLSAPMGRVAERLGPRRGFRVGLTTSALAMLAVALLARNVWQFCLLLGVAGAGNALNQPSANLMLATHIEGERLGFALAAKQSGMPAAALLGGVAVPAIALTVGWQWAYVAGIVVAVGAMLSFPPDRRSQSDRNTSANATGDRRSARPDLGMALLVLYALVGLLGATSAGTMVGFITSGAEASGLGPGAAGLVLSLGSLVGVASRLIQGWQVDRWGVLPIQRLVWLFGLGGLGMLVLAIDVPITYVLAPIPAFAFGWAWPGLFNLSVVRNNPSAPAAATGVSQVGVFIGAAVGPALGGVIIDNGSYRLLWLFGASTLLLGSMLATVLRRQIRRNRERIPVASPGLV
ncbi:MFS transporter, partial [uncultured Ilumatobacter sp.]|uniref:MFS transporter n=1 Tax=uncultured Ilumatobacter sp. TaxID=879968 RepID=UPI00374E3DDE